MRGNKHQITVDGKTFWVDSNQEEYLIRWLEDNGFHDRWRRLPHGINVGSYNYTPDLELSIQLDGMTHRAIVESKPNLKSFQADHSRRMRGVARHYFSDVLLLYVHDKKYWYRVDIETGAVEVFDVPVPGEIPIRKLYKPFAVPARSVWSHTYRKRPEILKNVALLVVDALQAGLMEVFGPKKKRRRRTRRRRP